MKKIKVFIAVSLDAFIAPPDGGMNWLSGLSCPTLKEYLIYHDDKKIGMTIFASF
jgi:hypothetical protein